MTGITEEMVVAGARGIYEASPWPEREGPFEKQSEEYRSLCGIYARSALTAALPGLAEGREWIAPWELTNERMMEAAADAKAVAIEARNKRIMERIGRLPQAAEAMDVWIRQVWIAMRDQYLASGKGE